MREILWDVLEEENKGKNGTSYEVTFWQSLFTSDPKQKEIKAFPKSWDTANKMSLMLL